MIKLQNAAGRQPIRVEPLFQSGDHGVLESSGLRMHAELALKGRFPVDQIELVVECEAAQAERRINIRSLLRMTDQIADMLHDRMRSQRSSARHIGLEIKA